MQDLMFFGPLYVNGVYELGIVQNLVGIPGTKPEQIVGKAVYDMTNFDLNAGILQFTYNDTPIGKIGVHFESFEASVRSALEQARKAWAEKRANKQ